MSHCHVLNLIDERSTRFWSLDIQLISSSMACSHLVVSSNSKDSSKGFGTPSSATNSIMKVNTYLVLWWFGWSSQHLLSWQLFYLLNSIRSFLNCSTSGTVSGVSWVFATLLSEFFHNSTSTPTCFVVLEHLFSLSSLYQTFLSKVTL